MHLYHRRICHASLLLCTRYSAFARGVASSLKTKKRDQNMTMTASAFCLAAPRCACLPLGGRRLARGRPGPSRRRAGKPADFIRRRSRAGDGNRTLSGRCPPRLQVSRRRDCHSAAPPLPLVGVSIWMESGCHFNDSLAYCRCARGCVGYRAARSHGRLALCFSHHSFISACLPAVCVPFSVCVHRCRSASVRSNGD